MPFPFDFPFDFDAQITSSATMSGTSTMTVVGYRTRKGTATMAAACTMTADARELNIVTMQQAQHVDLVRVVLAKTGEDTLTYYNNARLLVVSHIEQDDSYVAQIVLSNHDNLFTDLDLRGYTATISWGIRNNEGEFYVARAPLTVLFQHYNSAPQQLYCALTCISAINKMARQLAHAEYLPASDDTDTLKDHINYILGGTVDHAGYGFSGYGAIGSSWDSEDDVIDAFILKNYYKCYKGESRLAKINECLGYSKVVKRVEKDGKIHFINPTISGVTYDYSYILSGGHTFFTKSYTRTVVMPNYVEVLGTEWGTATDTFSNTILPVQKSYTLPAASEAQAVAIAEALLQKITLAAQRGTIPVPMNILQQIWDYVSITDAREGGSVRTGNVQYIKRVWQAGSGSKDSKIKMEIRFGSSSAPIPNAATGVKTSIEDLNNIEQTAWTEESGGYATQAYVISECTRIVDKLGDLAEVVATMKQSTIDPRIDDAIDSGDATTDGVIDAMRDVLIAQGLIQAS